MLAVELYRAKQRVDQLEKNLSQLRHDNPDRAELQQQIRKARAEETRLKAMLEGAKES